MPQKDFFTAEEIKELKVLYRQLLNLSGNILKQDDCKKLKKYIIEATNQDLIKRNVFGMNPMLLREV